MSTIEELENNLSQLKKQKEMLDEVDNLFYTKVNLIEEAFRKQNEKIQKEIDEDNKKIDKFIKDFDRELLKQFADYCNGIYTFKDYYQSVNISQSINKADQIKKILGELEKSIVLEKIRTKCNVFIYISNSYIIGEIKFRIGFEKLEDK